MLGDDGHEGIRVHPCGCAVLGDPRKNGGTLFAFPLKPTRGSSKKNTPHVLRSALSSLRRNPKAPSLETTPGCDNSVHSARSLGLC